MDDPTNEELVDPPSLRESSQRAERLDALIRYLTYALLTVVTLLAVAALTLSWITANRMLNATNDIDSVVQGIETSSREAQLSARRNTELLAIECDLETGYPYAFESGEPFVNSEAFLQLFCERQIRRAREISEYIALINQQIKDQVDTHDKNMTSQHGLLEQQVVAPSKIRSQRSAITQKPPAAPTSKPVAPRPTSSISLPESKAEPECEKSGKSNKCKKK